jgi:hypothetical protein
MMFVLVAFSLALTGCGRELKLSIRASEDEKDQPSMALVRKIELSYHSPAGEERMREGVAVFGLSQPVSVKSELLRDLEVEDGGLFVARGYSGDGRLFLEGSAAARPDETDLVEIVLGREANERSALASTLIQKIELAGELKVAERVFEADELSAAARRGECLRLPPWVIPTNARSSPEIVFSTRILSDLHFQAGSMSEGKFVPWNAQERISQNGLGQSALALDHRFFDGLLYKKRLDFVLKIFSKEYEGCLNISSKPELASPVLSVSSAKGTEEPPLVIPPRPRGQEHLSGPRVLYPVAWLRVTNPNAIPLKVRVTGTVTLREGPKPMCAWTGLTEEGIRFFDARFERSIGHELTVRANDKGYVYFYGAAHAEGGECLGFTGAGLEVNWEVEADGVASQSKKGYVN